MEWKDVAKLLPVQPSDDLKESILQSVYEMGELGQCLFLYHRENVEVTDPIMQTMTGEDWERWERSRRSHWGARCTCSNCGEEFIAGYTKGGIVLSEGLDGQIYDGWVDKNDEGTVVFDDGDEVCCPNCYFMAVVTPRRKLRSGRTHRVLQAEVVNVAEYTAVMYWMVSRQQDDAGMDQVQFIPHQALVIDHNGKLRRFRAMRQSCEVKDVVWKPCTRTCDPMQRVYYSYDAAWGKKIGGWTFEYGPELDGHTGEKTALDEYIGAGGAWPGAYLHVWQRWPQVENLMRQGFGPAVMQEIDDQLDRAAYHHELHDTPPITWVNWCEVKPHKMLGMSKDAFRVIRDAKWTAEDAKGWMLWRTVLQGADALEYEACRKKVSTKGVRSLLEMIQAGWNAFDPMRVVRYLEKRNMLQDGVQHLIDYRIMLRDAHLVETAETLWPRNLLAAHDRVAQQLAAERDLAYAGSFTITRMKLDGLEWTDGKLCIVIPQTEQELKDEGRILRHCVGTYGKSHCGGKPVFFVRHYRRPERSYYTLNIDMTGGEPKRIQLHGYGNEHHGENKQYTHTIPKEVQEFCDRWEREVLTPWWNKKRQARLVAASKDKKKEAAVA